MKAFYLLSVYDKDTGDTLFKSVGYTKKDCVEIFLDLEKLKNKELDFHIKEVYLDEATNVCD